MLDAKEYTLCLTDTEVEVVIKALEKESDALIREALRTCRWSVAETTQTLIRSARYTQDTASALLHQWQGHHGV